MQRESLLVGFIVGLWSEKVWVMEDLKQFGYFLCWCFAVGVSRTSWFYGARIRTKRIGSVSYRYLTVRFGELKIAGRTLHRTEHALFCLCIVVGLKFYFKIQTLNVWLFYISMFGCLWLILTWTHLSCCIKKTELHRLNTVFK